MAIAKQVLKNVETNADLLSYSINISPELSQDLDLPKQGEDLNKYGTLIMNNMVYKNAFINAVNVIARTVLVRSYFRNPYSFMYRGMLNYGQGIREIFVDIAEVFDYNDMMKKIEDGTWSCAHFACNVVPNITQYTHLINYQKYYKTTTSDYQMAMAFTNGSDFFNVIDEIVNSNWRGYEYDNFLMGKYILARAALNGFIASRSIPSAMTDIRDRAAFIQNIGAKMLFMSRNFNPAGARTVSDIDNLKIMLNTEFQAQFNVNVLATSYFKNNAEFKMDLALVDSFSDFDEERLQMLLGKDYVPFTETEKETLHSIAAIVIDERWFQFYNYELDGKGDDSSNAPSASMFFNGETRRTNHWLHVWGIRDFSPFYNACVITFDEIGVTSITLNQEEITVSKGQQVQLFANVVTTGFANKAVFWSTDDTEVKVNQNGLISIPSTYTGSSFTVTVTSIYDNSKTATATITVV